MVSIEFSEFVRVSTISLLERLLTKSGWCLQTCSKQFSSVLRHSLHDLSLTHIQLSSLKRCCMRRVPFFPLSRVKSQILIQEDNNYLAIEAISFFEGWSLSESIKSLLRNSFLEDFAIWIALLGSFTGPYAGGVRGVRTPHRPKRSAQDQLSIIMLLT